MGNEIDIVAGAFGFVLLLLSGWFGMRFYPPGEGYAQERRNNRIALILLAASLALIAIQVTGLLIGGT